MELARHQVGSPGPRASVGGPETRAWRPLNRRRVQIWRCPERAPPGAWPGGEGSVYTHGPHSELPSGCNPAQFWGLGVRGIRALHLLFRSAGSAGLRVPGGVPLVSLPCVCVCARARRPPPTPPPCNPAQFAKVVLAIVARASSGVAAGARAVLRRARVCVCVLGRLGRDLNIYELCSTRTRRVYLALCSSPLPRHAGTLTFTRTRTPACKLARLGARRRVASAPAPPRELPR